MMARWLAWSLWPLFALFVVGAGVVLLPACGVATPFTATVLPALGWNFCPVTSSALSNEAQRQAELGKRIAELQLELSRRQLACVSVPPVTLPPLDLPTEAGPPQPQQTAELKPPPPPAPLPAERWEKKDLGMLEGCWQLGRDTTTTRTIARGTERCTVKAGKLCFGADGSGSREMTMECPTGGTVRCAAPIKAQFGGGSTLGTTQPEVKCEPASTVWHGPQNGLTCRRRSDTLASCKDGGGFEHEFRR